jgi:hypothetical protein
MGLAAGTIAVSALLTAVALVGYAATVRRRLTAAEILVAVSIAILALVPVWTYRYLLPLAPFLFLYLVRGIEAATSRFAAAAAARAARVAPIFLLCVIALDLADHAQYVAIAHGPRGAAAIDWLGDAKEIDDLLGWMRRNVAGDGAVASTNPPLVYLATGRRTVAFDDTPERIAELRRMGIRYLVALRPVELPRTQPPSTVLYRTARLWIAAAPR